MEIQINTIDESGQDLTFEAEAQSLPELAALEESGEYRFLGPIHVSLRADRVGGTIRTAGEFKVDLGITCSRCLSEFKTALSDRFELTFIPEDPETEKHSEHQEIELSPEEIISIPYQGETIDLRGPVQEQVVMALPISALCSKKCKGLCPQCGADLNRGGCGCEKLPPRSAFAVLENLKIKQ